MPTAGSFEGTVEQFERAVVEIERVCRTLNDTNAQDELDQRPRLERLVVALQHLDVARASVGWAEQWV
jgi:hypothetical protein